MEFRLQAECSEFASFHLKAELHAFLCHLADSFLRKARKLSFSPCSAGL